jgi:hypothetical protein
LKKSLEKKNKKNITKNKDKKKMTIKIQSIKKKNPK